jgi:ABC-type uncharacterized transport system substrate-binding protein
VSFFSSVRHLLLGFLLIGAAAGVLLVSDWNQRQTGGSLKRVAIVQIASQAALDDGVRGYLDALAERGFVDGKTISVQKFNAENDIGTANAIAKQVVDGGYDLILTASTLSMQTVANANRAGKSKHVFGIVTDPTTAGVGVSSVNPLDHPKQMTGIGSLVSVEAAFAMAKTLYPNLRKVGLVWNAAESNSQSYTKAGRAAGAKLGIELLEANAENSSNVLEAASSLVSRGAEALFISGDVTVLVAADSVIAAAKKGHIPVFTLIPPSVTKGALFDLGANFYEIGKQVGDLAANVLSGTDTATIPIVNVVVPKLAINTTALTGLRDSWKIPKEVVDRAELVIDQSGTRDKGLKHQAVPNKKWNLQVVELNNVLDVEETEQGVMQGLEEARLVQGKDYDIKVRNAQGDMATLNGLVDAAIGSGADLLITLSTPTLQAAIQRSHGKVPIVFTYVSNAVIAGAGKSDEDHLPYLTGVTLVAPFEEMLKLIKQILPSAKRLGTLFVPSEVNMVFVKEEMVKAAAKEGMEVAAMGVSTSSEVPDAALALMGRNIDALCQIPGNMTAAAFGGIAKAATRKKIPVFAFQNAQAKEGAQVVIGRDYHEAGVSAAAMAVRIMRGEKPGKIPFTPVTKTRLIVNPGAAQAIGLTLPPELLKRAAETIRND